MRRNKIFVIAASIIILLFCTAYYWNHYIKAHKQVYKQMQISENNKKFLNILPELPLGNEVPLALKNFKTIDTEQETYALEENDKNTCAFAFDRSRYAYIGCNLTPARIVKFDLAEMKRIASLDLPANQNRDETRVAALIAISPDIIIHGSFTDPCVFTRIDGKSMKITGTLKGSTGKNIGSYIKRENSDRYIRSMTYDGQFVYAGNYSIPGKINKIDPISMKMIDSVTFNEDEISDIYAITICGHYLVGVCERDEDTKSTIFRLDLNDLHKRPDVLFIRGYSKYHSICTDGKNIYAASDTNPTKVVKIDALASHLTFVSAFSGEKVNEVGNFSMVYDGKDIIVGTWNLNPHIKDRLIVLDSNTMKRKNTIISPHKFPSDLMYLEPYIYTSCDQPTGLVLRLKYDLTVSK